MHDLIKLEESLNNSNAKIDHATLNKTIDNRAMIRKYLMRGDNGKISYWDNVDNFVDRADREDKQETHLLTNMARAVEHLFKTLDIRLQSTNINPEITWNENVHILGMTRQTDEGVSSSLDTFLRTLGESESLGKAIDILGKKNHSEFISSVNFPKDALLKESNNPQFALMCIGSHVGDGGVLDLGVLPRYHLDPLWDKVTSNIQKENKDTIDQITRKQFTDKLDDISQQIDAALEADPNKIPEVLIVLNVHSLAVHNANIPQPFDQFEGAWEGTQLTLGKDYIIDETELKNLINQLAKKAKVYIVFSACHAAAYISQNKSNKKTLNVAA